MTRHPGAVVLLTALASAPGAAAPRVKAAVEPPAAVMPVVTDAARLERAWQGPGATVVHFWASWCGTCKAELPRLAKALERAQERGANVLLVSLDDAEHAEAARRLLRAHRVPGARWRLDVAEPREVTARLDPAWDAALPATFVFKEGERTASLLGAIASPGVLDEALR